MKLLRVSLDYRPSGFNRPDDQDAGVALPVKALDAEGTVLDEGYATASQAAELHVPDNTGMAYVRLTWPSGRTETRRADLSDSKSGDVSFSDAGISRDEWAAWAVPKLNPQTPLARPEGASGLGMTKFDTVWLRLWRFDDGSWRREKLQPIEAQDSEAARQIDLNLAEANWLLQIGGSKVTWRFVALPGGGRVRVLITPKDSKDPRADELKVVITGFRERAETLLEFLSRDAMRSAHAIADSFSYARHLLAEKFVDPVGAVAGAYYLLRFNRWDDVPLWWMENLSVNFPWLPDTSIVHCARLLRSSSDLYTDKFNPEKLLQECLSRGWPVFAEGQTLLQEAASLLKPRSEGAAASRIDQIEELGAARAWAGAAASFYGRTPYLPETLQWVGKPEAPRRRKIIRELVKPTPAYQRAALGLAEASRGIRSYTMDSLSAEFPIRRLKSLPSGRVEVIEDDDEFLLGNIARLARP